MKERIMWIDIAKCICIILTIAGHELPYNSMQRNFIYSFHMPLFFILSGYTFHFDCKNISNLLSRIYKDVKHLLVPVICIWLVESIWIYTFNSSNISLKCFFENRIYVLFWASGYNENAPYLGALWFLVSMFWARSFIRCILYVFHTEENIYICVIIGVLAVIGGKNCALPQNFDVTAVAIMLIALGMIWKKNMQYVKKNITIFFLASICVWQSLLHHGIYIEMATRYYPLGVISVVESVCGTFVCCCVAKSLTGNIFLNKYLAFIGRHTLLLYGIHCLDWLLRDFWYVGEHINLTIFLRTFTDFIVWIIFLFLLDCGKKIKCISHKKYSKNFLIYGF